jgi:hypothetical protein
MRTKADAAGTLTIGSNSLIGVTPLREVSKGMAACSKSSAAAMAKERRSLLARHDWLWMFRCV